MTIPDLPRALLLTLIHQIAGLLLVGACGDGEAAVAAAAETLLSYDAKTVTELRLAARIISCSLQAGAALAQAANPELPLTRVLRLRSGAVNLSREAEKAERQLAKLRDNRLMGVPQEPEPAVEAEPPALEKTTALIDENRTVGAYAKAHGISFTQALKQRYREQRQAERQRKQEKRAAAAPAPAAPPPAAPPHAAPPHAVAPAPAFA